MSVVEWTALLPYLVLTAGILVVVLLVSFWRNHELIAMSSNLVLAITFASVIFSYSQTSVNIDQFLVLDSYASFFNGLFLAAALVTSLLALPYLEGRAGQQEEFYILLLLATLGAMTVAAATNFAALLLGMEILSVSLYALIAYPEEGHPPLEAAIKYLILSGVSSTTMLFGMALVYHATGGLSLADIASGQNEELSTLFTVGQLFLVCGLAFKLSLVPFHMWTPDVYHGAPAPVTGYIATVSKAAAFAFLLRYAIEVQMLGNQALYLAIATLGCVSMILGNLLALRQQNIKRVLAYSSIAHLGYLLIALLTLAMVRNYETAVETSLVYLAGYTFITLAAFAVISQVPSRDSGGEAMNLDDYQGLFWRHPVLATTLTVALLSLAGIPLTLGFVAKFYVFLAGVESGLWWLVWSLIVGSAIGVYYYLRIVFVMTRKDETTQKNAPAASGLMVTIVLTIVILGMGIYPTPLIELAREVVGALG